MASGRPRRGLVRALLGLPLGYKLLIANSVIVFVAAFVSASAVHEKLSSDPDVTPWSIILATSAGALVVSVLVNAVVVSAALWPLVRLEEAAKKVQSGDLEARAELTPTADPAMEELVETFNAMLDSVVDYRGRLREVASRALDAGEAERLRISQELHDGVAQALAAVLLHLKIARDVKDAAERNALISEAADRLSRCIEDLRTIAGELRPPALDMLGLPAALESYARRLSESTGMKIDVEVDRLDRELPPEAELVLYRLIQDALGNVLRHADAEQARLTLRGENGAVKATVVDNGRGFAPGEVLHRNRGLGLLGMRERAAYVGGWVEVESAPGRGTTVQITLPVSDKRNV